MDTRRATEDPADILDSMSKDLRERNAVDMVLCAAAVGGWCAMRISGRGKSELHRAVCLVTRGRGDPTESATENIPPRSRGVRVKWCGKSAPRPW